MFLCRGQHCIQGCQVEANERYPRGSYLEVITLLVHKACNAMHVIECTDDWGKAVPTTEMLEAKASSRN